MWWATRPERNRRISCESQRRLGVLVVEGVLAVRAPQALVDVQAVPRLGHVRLRHEGRPQAMIDGDLLDDVLEDHRRVGDLDRRPVAEVDLDLGRPVLDVPRLDDDAGGFEGAPDVADDGSTSAPFCDRVAVHAL